MLEADFNVIHTVVRSGMTWELQGSNCMGVWECDFKTQYMQSLYHFMVKRLQQCIAIGGNLVDGTACEDWPWSHCDV
jgi:hypothetical protein